MDNLYIPPTPSSPEVDFKFDENTLSLRGESYPENAAAFFGDILRQLEAYLGACDGRKITVSIALAYFNSSSTKMLFNLVGLLSDAAEAGNEVVLNWFHDEEDDTIFEFGQELKDDFTAIQFVNHAVKSA
ncbi:DUF1987 domain-containing protein [Acidovorax sp.]|jgi:hypothetical protein|uniref:DUF1987 domain-containing protein n=1 Tax=Acidovorax sp. TaxID=1872122 RepID=UPI00391EF092